MEPPRRRVSRPDGALALLGDFRGVARDRRDQRRTYAVAARGGAPIDAEQFALAPFLWPLKTAEPGRSPHLFARPRREHEVGLQPIGEPGERPAGALLQGRAERHGIVAQA